MILYIKFDFLYEISLFLRIKCFKGKNNFIIYKFQNRHLLYWYNIRKKAYLYINLYNDSINFIEIKDFKVKKDIFYGLIKFKLEK